MTMDFQSDLNALRARIDACDTQMIALLKQRTEAVLEVGVLKRSAVPDVCPLRPDRETAQLRKIAASFDDSHFSGAAAAFIWRHMINSSLAAEGEFNLTVGADDETHPLVWLARGYFGAYTPLAFSPGPIAMLDQLVTSPPTIGIVPAKTTRGEAWWLELARRKQAGEAAPSVFLPLPYFAPLNEEHRPVCYALAMVAQEALDDEVRLVVAQQQRKLPDGVRIIDAQGDAQLLECSKNASLDDAWSVIGGFGEPLFAAIQTTISK